jgi:hypothetical protein
MRMFASGVIRRCLRKFGYDVCWSDERRDPFEDMNRLTQASPVIFDVGATLGQTIESIQATFDKPTIHEARPRSISGAKRVLRDY